MSGETNELWGVTATPKDCETYIVAFIQGPLKLAQKAAVNHFIEWVEGCWDDYDPQSLKMFKRAVTRGHWVVALKAQAHMSSLLLGIERGFEYSTEVPDPPPFE